MPKQTEYQRRKSRGWCVRPGCKNTPRKHKDGTRRSYCDFHNEQNAKNTAAFIKRQKAKAKKPKKAAVRKPKATAVTPMPVILKDAV